MKSAKALLGGLVVAALASSATVRADTGTVTTDVAGYDLTVNGIPLTLSDLVTSSGGDIFTYVFSGAGQSASVTVTGDVDPFLAYSFSAVNATGSAQTYHFGFSHVITAVKGASQVKASLQGTLTDNTGDGAAYVTPVGSFMQTAYVKDGAAQAALNVGLGGALGPTGPAAAGTHFAYGPGYAPGPLPTLFAAGPVAPDTNGWTVLGFHTDFVLSAHDSFSGNGRIEIDPVPEPGSWGMIAGGVAALGVIARRRLQAI